MPLKNLQAKKESDRLYYLKNRKKAIEMLKSKLALLKKKEAKEEVTKIKGNQVKVEWGSQIRSYVLYPYKMVKDHRTKIETSDVDDVLDGNLEEFIKAELKTFN